MVHLLPRVVQGRLIMEDAPPETVQTGCDGGARVLTLRRDAAGEIIWRSTHPTQFSNVHAEGQHCSYLCSHCGGCVSVPEDTEQSRRELVELYGGSKHTPACARRRARKRQPDVKEDNASKKQKQAVSIKLAKNKPPPPLPTDSGALRRSFPFPPFSVRAQPS